MLAAAPDRSPATPILIGCCCAIDGATIDASTRSVVESTVEYRPLRTMTRPPVRTTRFPSPSCITSSSPRENDFRIADEGTLMTSKLPLDQDGGRLPWFGIVVKRRPGPRPDEIRSIAS